MKIYIASKLENYLQVQALRDALIAAGHTITYDWTLHGSVQGQGEARLREVAAAERNGVLQAELVIVLLPGGHGTHTELGMANALGKPVIIFSAFKEPFDEYEGATCAFYWNENVRQVYSHQGQPEMVLPNLIRHKYEVVPA